MNTRSSYFEDMYRTSADSWRLEGRWYERRKYQLTVGYLPRHRYRAAFESGCSAGILTCLLAARCDRLLATDRVAAATRAAAERTRDLGHVDWHPRHAQLAEHHAVHYFATRPTTRFWAHPHVHGANLSFTAAAYGSIGGFQPTAHLGGTP